MKKMIERVNETKRLFLENVNRIDKPLARFIEKKRAQINKIKSEKGEVIADTTEIQMIIRDYCKQLYANPIKWTIEKIWTNS